MGARIVEQSLGWPEVEYVAVLDGSDRGIEVKATADDVARWEAVTEAYARVQIEMRRLYEDAEEAEVAALPPLDPDVPVGNVRDLFPMVTTAS